MSRIRILVGGAYLSYKFFKEVVRKTTGVSAEAPLIVTLFAVGVVANAFRRIAASAFKPFRPAPPSLPALVAAVAIPSAIVQRSTGVPARDAPYVAGGIAFGAVVPTFNALVLAARAVPAALGAVVRFAIGRP